MNRNRPLRVHSSQLGVFGLPAAGLVSEFDKINILTSEDSSRLGVFTYLPRGASNNFVKALIYP
jgi:hypothetical protein